MVDGLRSIGTWIQFNDPITSGFSCDLIYPFLEQFIYCKNIKQCFIVFFSGGLIKKLLKPANKKNFTVFFDNYYLMKIAVNPSKSLMSFVYLFS